MASSTNKSPSAFHIDVEAAFDTEPEDLDDLTDSSTDEPGSTSCHIELPSVTKVPAGLTEVPKLKSCLKKPPTPMELWLNTRTEAVINQYHDEEEALTKHVELFRTEVKKKFPVIRLLDITSVGRMLGAGASGSVYQVLSCTSPCLSAVSKPLVFKYFSAIDERSIYEEVFAASLGSSSKDNTIIIVESPFDNGSLSYTCGFLMEMQGKSLYDRHLPDMFDLLAFATNAILGMNGRARSRSRQSILSILKDGMQVSRHCASFHAKGLVHSDLKPDNILASLNPQETGSNVVVIDFSVSVPIDPRTGYARLRGGSAFYASPSWRQELERTENDPSDLDAYCQGTSYDVFSLGIILYELLSGTRAQEVNSSRDVEGTHEVLIRRARKALRSHLDKAEAEAIIMLLDGCVNEEEQKRPSMVEVQVILEWISKLS